MNRLRGLSSFRLLPVLLAVIAGLTMRPAPSSGAELNFGFESASAEESTSAAGLHPDVTTSFVLNHLEPEGTFFSSGRVQEVAIDFPPGFVGRVPSFPSCSLGDFNAFGDCPVASQVGTVRFRASQIGGGLEPLYSLQPSNDSQIARFGFYAFFYPIYIDISVRTASDYGVTAAVHDASGQAALISSRATIWGVPSDPVHDEQRLTTLEAFSCESACTAPEGKRSSGLRPPLPLLENPTACEEQPVTFKARSYQLPGRIFTEGASLPPITGCADTPFEPRLEIEPSNHRAGAPVALSAILRMPQTDRPNIPSTSPVRKAKVTLPEGMTLNSAAANGLEACSDEQVALGKEVASQCPDGAKIGTAAFLSPALPKALHGAVYQRTPGKGDLFRVWLVTDELGLHLKLPGEIKTNQTTGQLTAEFDETPQLPVEQIDLEFKGGPQAPLMNPDSCGSYSASYEFTPWSGNPPVAGKTQPIQIDEGCGKGGFAPKLEAGVVNPVAGGYSPFVVNLKREDGEDNVSSLELSLPKGELAKLKGVPICPDADAPSGNCAPDSQIGSVAAAVGAGPQPLWIPQPGKSPTAVYLGGPYKGAPYSVITKVPAQAGPFDLGTVTVRGGLYVDPNTAQATVKTDPLPQILEGVPVLYRTIHVSVDRDQFAISPTNCREQLVQATVAAAHGAVAHPSDRFQVGECAALKFSPSLKLRLKGGTKRAQYPALTATLTTHKNEANFRKVSVALPHSEFLAQEHINTICTRVQFAEEACPNGSIYGRAKAITPLLDKPLEGSVYLRSSDNPLPDLVVALRGQLAINLVGRIDSVRGGIRTTFEGIPDAPVTKFVLKMKGGKKSLLVNSTDICSGMHRATVKMGAQNGKHHNPHPPVSGGC